MAKLAELKGHLIILRNKYKVSYVNCDLDSGGSDGESYSTLMI